MADNRIYITLNAGHFRRYLEAMRNGLDVAIKGMAEVRETYCKECGTELAVKEVRETERAVIKYCPKCGESCVFRAAGDE